MRQTHDGKKDGSPSDKAATTQVPQRPAPAAPVKPATSTLAKQPENHGSESYATMQERVERERSERKPNPPAAQTVPAVATAQAQTQEIAPKQPEGSQRIPMPPIVKMQLPTLTRYGQAFNEIEAPQYVRDAVGELLASLDQWARESE